MANAHWGWPLMVAVVLMWTLPGGVSGFNVDVEQPAVYRAGAERAVNHNRPEPGSMFGFSLSQHITRRGEYKILVGAPKANTSQPGVTEGGAVFQCDVMEGVGGAISCRNLTLDSNGNSRRDLGNGFGPQPIEEKSHQWFGATVCSSKNATTGGALVCGPRYTYNTRNIDKRLPVGLCYYYNDSPTTIKLFAPLKNTADYYSQQEPEAMTQIDKEGQGLYGIAAALSQDGRSFLSGAAGSFSFRGRLYEHGLRDSTSMFSQYNDTRLPDYSYMGYAVAFGKFSNDGDTAFIASAPRGGVLMNGGGDVQPGMSRVYDDTGARTLTVLDILVGKQMGEYLGYSLAVGDFNGDGLDDLAAGAPFYAETGSAPDTGRVQIHYQKKLGLIYLRPQYLEGLKESRERFGHSLANLGDLNKDGFTDLAVGAPYGGRRGHGAVYIFHGSRRGIKSPFSQVIDAAQISNNLRTFGYSISSGLDMDRNGYPDITIGAYSSDSVVQLWTRPVLWVYLNLTVPPTLDIKQLSHTLPDGREVASFPVRLHYRYFGKSSSSLAYLNVTVLLDAGRNTAPRAFFYTPSGRTRTYHRTRIPINNNRGESVIDVPHTAFIKPGMRDKLAPIVVEVNYDVDVEVGRGLAEVFDADIPRTVRAEIYIEKNCGEDRVCFADLSVAAHGVTKEFILGESTIEIQVQVNNSAEDDAFESQVSVQLPQGTTYTGIQHVTAPVAVRCLPRHRVSHEEEGLRAVREGRQDYAETVVCEIGNPLPGYSQVDFTLRLDAQKFDGSVNRLTFYLNVSSSNPENSTTTEDNQAVVDISARAVTNIRLSGISKPEQLLFTPDSSSETQRQQILDDRVTHLYELRNLGPSTIQTASIYIYWPSRFDEGDYSEDLFVLTEAPKITQGRGMSSCEIVSNPLSPRNVSNTTETVHSRTKRNTQSFTEKFSSRKTVNKMVACTSRGKEEAWCTVIRCELTTLEADDRALVDVRARLLATSLAELSHMTILVTSQAVARVETVPYGGVPVELSVKTNRVDTILATRGAGQGEVKMWVIGVSIGGGIVVLLLMILVMYKCGFFKRSLYGNDDAMLDEKEEDEEDEEMGEEQEEADDEEPGPNLN